MTLTKKTTLVQEALDTLVSQFQGKANLEAFLSVFASQIQKVEDVHFELLLERALDVAVGAQLDGLGDIVGEDRNDRTDPDYRLAIRARIRLNTGSGTIEDLLILVSLLAPGKAIKVVEDFPAHFDLQITEPITEDGFVISSLVQDGKPAGVRGIFLWEPADAFRFDTAGKGFDEGKFAGAADF